MTIDQFAQNIGKKRKTVEKWIREELIPNAILENDYVPDSARQPYTKARAKSAKAIYISMVDASSKRQHIMPKLYKLCEDEFEAYANKLIEAGFLERRISDDVTYYDATIEADSINKKNILDTIKAVTYGVAEGVASAILNQNGG